MKNIIFYVTLLSGIYSFSSYGMENPEVLSESAPRKLISRPKNPHEMMALFKQQTPPEEFLKLKKIAHEILENEKKEQLKIKKEQQILILEILGLSQKVN